MAQSTNTKSKPLEGLYTDTDSDNRSEIITDITIRVPGKAGTMMMEVNVDPRAQPRQHPALTGARSHSCCRDMVLLGATMVMAKEAAGSSRRRRHQRSHQGRKHMRLHSRTRPIRSNNYIWWREREW